MLADLVAHLAAGVTKQARDYATAAARADGHLRESLEGLGRRKHDQAATSCRSAAPWTCQRRRRRPRRVQRPPPSWGVTLGEAFQGERTLESIGRELAVLAQEPALKASAARLAAGAARDGGEVRKLYLRYT